MTRAEGYDTRWDAVGAPLAAEAVASTSEESRQYSLATTLAIWAAAALPMAMLGWAVPPLLGDRVDLGLGAENNIAFARAGLLTLGLMWQFVLVLGIVRHEEGDLRWSTVRRRCWLGAPRDPSSGASRARLWLWLVPAVAVAVLIQVAPLQGVWERALPFLAEPERYSFEGVTASGERKAALEGAWHVLALFVVLGIFNTVLGEELLFRGVLLPRMRGTFGRADWLVNGVLFGLYHLHQPWSIPGSVLGGTLCYALPSARFRSAWFGITVHSGETVFFIALALGLVLGLA